jgi:hypothetical protein
MYLTSCHSRTGAQGCDLGSSVTLNGPPGYDTDDLYRFPDKDKIGMLYRHSLDMIQLTPAGSIPGDLQYHLPSLSSTSVSSAIQHILYAITRVPTDTSGPLNVLSYWLRMPVHYWRKQ